MYSYSNKTIDKEIIGASEGIELCEIVCFKKNLF